MADRITSASDELRLVEVRYAERRCAEARAEESRLARELSRVEPHRERELHDRFRRAMASVFVADQEYRRALTECAA